MIKLFSLQSLRFLLATRRQRKRTKLGSRSKLLKSCQTMPGLLTSRLPRYGVTSHHLIDKRPHELPDRLLKSGSGLSKERSVSLAVTEPLARPQRPARKAYSTDPAELVNSSFGLSTACQTLASKPCYISSCEERRRQRMRTLCLSFGLCKPFVKIFQTIRQKASINEQQLVHSASCLPG